MGCLRECLKQVHEWKCTIVTYNPDYLGQSRNYQKSLLSLMNKHGKCTFEDEHCAIEFSHIYDKRPVVRIKLRFIQWCFAFTFTTIQSAVAKEPFWIMIEYHIMSFMTLAPTIVAYPRYIASVRLSVIFYVKTIKAQVTALPSGFGTCWYISAELQLVLVASTVAHKSLCRFSRIMLY